jgi:protein-tyrosine phosphatase
MKTPRAAPEGNHMATEEEHRPRLLAWEGCLNARDLGGYPTHDGREIRWGAITRADCLTPLTRAGRAAVVEHGVRSIVDLRTPQELEDHPNPFAQPGSHGIVYTNVSFVDPAADLVPGFTTLADSYKHMLDRFQPAVGAIMTAIAQAPEGGVLVHCMGGKDRTGVVSALLLDLAGVPRPIIGEDYALTAECLWPREEEWLENGPGERAERERELEKYAPRPEVMLDMLEHVDTRYGGVEAYLLEAGVAAADIARIRDRLVARRNVD